MLDFLTLLRIFLFQQMTKTEEVYIFYGMTEVGGCVVQHEFQPPPGSCGKPIGCVEVKVSNNHTYVLKLKIAFQKNLERRLPKCGSEKAKIRKITT